MNPELVQDALIDAVKTTAQARSLTPHLPGYEYEAITAPGVIIDFTPIDRPGEYLSGVTKYETGQFTVGVVVTQGQGTSAAYGHANALASALNTAAYDQGATISFSGGTIRLTKPVDIRPGYIDGAHWRVPVVASYEAKATT